MTFLLGIDLGSTTIKTILYDLNGTIVARASRPMRRFHPNPAQPEWTVWEPTEIWSETAAACRETVAQIDDPAKIKGVATTGMGMDGLPMREDGTPLYPLISWHDTRTQPQYDWWIKTITAEKTYSIGGNPVWAINSALRMLWIQENEPQIFAETFRWLLIEDYVNYLLTGQFATDYSMASCTMLFDQRRLTWSEEMCRLAHIPMSILPEVLPGSTFLGGVTEPAANATGLSVGTPVFLGGHDHLCSSLPVGAFLPGTVLNITGTWETVDCAAKKPPLDTPLGRSGITTQAHVIPDTYMVWGGNPSGEMIEWYRREIASSIVKEHKLHPLNWDIMVREAEAARPGCDGILFLPHLDGSSCPQVDPRSCGSFVGLSTRTTHSELIRSIIEGLGFQLMNVLETMQQGLGERVTEIIAVGGAIRNKFWMQSKADMTGLTVCVPEVEEATVLGAAILAGIGAGLYNNAADAYHQTRRNNEIFKPNENLTRFYENLFLVYRDLYFAVAPIHHRLRAPSPILNR